MSGRARAGAAIAVFVIALGVYARTLAPSVGPTDSGELTIAAWSLGNAHPPGFPFFLILTHLFTSLPLGSIAVRANAASAFFAALACALTALAAGEILRLPREPAATSASPRKRPSKKGATPTSVAAAGKAAAAAEARGEGVIAIVMLATGLLLAFARTLWDFATVAEVYAVNTALMAGVAFGMLRWARTRNVLWMYLAALLFGLGLCVHHVTIGLGAFAIAVLLTRAGGAAVWRSRAALVSAGLIAAGLLVYAYLPIAAARKPVMNWGDPATAGAMFDHITGKQYRVQIRTSDETMSAQFGRWFDIAGDELVPLALLVSLAGLVLLFKRQRTIFWYVIAMMAADAAWFAVYPISDDARAYAIPAFLALLFAFAFAAAAAADLVRSPRARLGVAAAFLALPLLAFIAHRPMRDRSRYFVSHDFAMNALGTLKPNALLLTDNWQLYSPLRYELDVERARPDVIALDPSFLVRRWFRGELRRRWPQLERESARELDALDEMLPQFERDREHVDMQLFNQRIDDAILSLFRHHLQHGPIYVTADIAASNYPRDVNLKKRISDAWDLVPRGCVIELMPGHAIRGDVRFIRLQTRGVNDGTVEYDDEAVVPTEIAPAYHGMYVMTGRYLAVQRKFAEALEAYRAAVAIDPTNSATEREMRLVESQIPR